MNEKRCFLSYAQNDIELVSQEIIPILKDLDVTFQFDEDSLAAGETFENFVTRQMISSDFIISFGYNRSECHGIELGVAMAVEKPVIIVIDHDREDVSQFANCFAVHLDKSNRAMFKMDLKSVIDMIQQRV